MERRVCPFDMKPSSHIARRFLCMVMHRQFFLAHVMFVAHRFLDYGGGRCVVHASVILRGRVCCYGNTTLRRLPVTIAIVYLLHMSV